MVNHIGSWYHQRPEPLSPASPLPVHRWGPESRVSRGIVQGQQATTHLCVLESLLPRDPGRIPQWPAPQTVDWRLRGAGFAGAHSVNASLVPKEKPSWAQTSNRPGAHLACTDSGRSPGFSAGWGLRLWEGGMCGRLGNTWAAGLPSWPAALSRFSRSCPQVWADLGHAHLRARTLAPSSSHCSFQGQLDPESRSCPQSSHSAWSAKPLSICEQKGCLSPGGSTPWT